VAALLKLETRKEANGIFMAVAKTVRKDYEERIERRDRWARRIGAT